MNMTMKNYLLLRTSVATQILEYNLNINVWAVKSFSYSNNTCTCVRSNESVLMSSVIWFSGGKKYFAKEKVVFTEAVNDDTSYTTAGTRLL